MTKESRKPGVFSVIRAVGWVTFLEIIRDRVLYNIILCGFLVFGMGFLASRLSFVRPERIVLDFGLSALGISCAMLAIFTGSSLLAKEFDRRTIYVALSHPISRSHFVLGKYAGLCLILLLNWFLLSAVFLTILISVQTETSAGVHFTLIFGLFLILLQSFVLGSVAIFFSTFSTTSLSAIMSIGVYLVGNNISQVRLVASRVGAPIGRVILNSVAAIHPNLEHFNLGLNVTYGLPITGSYMTVSVLYGVFLVSLLLFFSGLLIHSREV